MAITKFKAATAPIRSGSGLPKAKLNSAGIQADIEAFRQFLTANANANTANGPVFKFTSLELQLRNWEELDVQVIPEPIRPTLSIADAQMIEGSTLTFTVSVDKADHPNAQITATYTITFPEGAGLDDLPPGTSLTGTGRKQIILVSDIATKGVNYISTMSGYF